MRNHAPLAVFALVVCTTIQLTCASCPKVAGTVELTYGPVTVLEGSSFVGDGSLLIDMTATYAYAKFSNGYTTNSIDIYLGLKSNGTLLFGGVKPGKSTAYCHNCIRTAATGSQPLVHAYVAGTSQMLGSGLPEIAAPGQFLSVTVGSPGSSSSSTSGVWSYYSTSPDYTAYFETYVGNAITNFTLDAPNTGDATPVQAFIDPVVYSSLQIDVPVTLVAVYFTDADGTTGSLSITTCAPSFYPQAFWTSADLFGTNVFTYKALLQIEGGFDPSTLYGCGFRIESISEIFNGPLQEPTEAGCTSVYKGVTAACTSIVCAVPDLDDQAHNGDQIELVAVWEHNTTNVTGNFVEAVAIGKFSPVYFTYTSGDPPSSDPTSTTGSLSGKKKKPNHTVGYAVGFTLLGVVAIGAVVGGYYYYGGGRSGKRGNYETLDEGKAVTRKGGDDPFNPTAMY